MGMAGNRTLYVRRYKYSLGSGKEVGHEMEEGRL